MRFLTHIKKHFFDIPIVFIVGKSREILALKAIGDGCPPDITSLIQENDG